MEYAVVEEEVQVWVSGDAVEHGAFFSVHGQVELKVDRILSLGQNVISAPALSFLCCLRALLCKHLVVHVFETRVDDVPGVIFVKEFIRLEHSGEKL